VELMGMNSVNPWTMPRMMACKTVMKVCDWILPVLGLVLDLWP